MPTVAHKKRLKPTAVDLFSGCGGLTLGLKQAGFDVLGAIELDSQAVKTYASNHRRVSLEHEDIRNICPEDFMEKIGVRPGELDLLAGCPPCQGFSSLRTRNGSAKNRDRRNDLVKQMLRFADALQPKALMLENVPGLTAYSPFKRLCNDLAERGYHVEYDVKDAADFGVPQRRRRLILLAGLGVAIPFARPVAKKSTVRDAIGHLQSPERSKDELHRLGERRSPRIQRLIRDIPKDGGSRTDLPKRRQLECHKKSDGFKDIYGRMSWDRVAPTITSGCFNPSKGRFLHPVSDRTITMREAALLQGFPPNYKFELSAGKQAIALMIGNALPPEFIRRHAVEIIKALGYR
jgi:DNA (cytosine-5)-methyltransferase 1